MRKRKIPSREEKARAWESNASEKCPARGIPETRLRIAPSRQALGPGALGKPRGSGWRGRWEEGSGWGTRVNPWLFHFSV